jgi:biotin synthase
MSCLDTHRPPAATREGGDDLNRFDAMQPRSPREAPRDVRNGARVKAAAVPPSGVYMPNNNVQTPAMRSPDYVQVSTAAAISLGLMKGRMHRCSCTHCLNLLLTYPEGCRANCAYCGLARHREADRDYADRNFIRVDWPAVPIAQIVDIVKGQGRQTPFQRMCISMITHPSSDTDAPAVLKAWTDRIDPSDIPVSILSNPTTMSRADVQRLKDLGADMFTVAFDAATPEIFERTRGKSVDGPHRWETYWEVMRFARDIFGPEKIGVHLIAGMGESEYDMLSMIQRVRDMGGHSHMFSFFPEKGSLMDHLPATPRDQWRRVQLGRYLIDYGGVRIDAMTFDEAGRVVHFGVSSDARDAVIEAGTAFRTSGCPGNQGDDISACDRPYGDSPPSSIASFPFQPNKRDRAKIRREMRLTPQET